MASLLKLYLRQLPEPLVPYGRYQEFLLCGRKLLSDRTQVRVAAGRPQGASASSTAASHPAPPTVSSQGLGELRSLLCELPFSNFNLLSFICQ